MSLSMAAAAVATSSSSSSTSLSLLNKLPHLPSDYYHSLTSIPTSHFAPKSKPTKFVKLKSYYHPHSAPLSLLFRSLLPRASAAFDTELPESESESEAEEDDRVEERETESYEAGRLYVGNLPYSMTSSELTEVFGEAGRVVSVEIVYDRVTDRSRGFAFVTMGSVDEAKEAIRMFEGSQVGGRTVKVNFPEVPKGGEREMMSSRIQSSNQGFVDSPHKLYAGNLNWRLTSEDLREAFADQPDLLSAKVIYDRDSGRSRGFGFLTFSSAEGMESALSSMNAVEVEGRPLRLNIAEERARTSSPARVITSENSFGSREMISNFGN
ncbi:RNA recognition motif domain protein [Actinidia chinensis var. chinensis]|uniref:RNA recognition motif domain protein n=1 Tax=Actinidia chinensis var. chinensis TaxID=1590841 RepID=A0A2R6Q426_ACTCC|nr:RNA recognition motif domain protein [Actinidia chinensis var. chinensis]